MKILVLQHARVEHPGIFRNFLNEDGHEYVAVELDEGEAIPSLDGCDALCFLGGPMDVWQEDAHPWPRIGKFAPDCASRSITCTTIGRG